jgi:hypothetical protein
MRRAPRRNQVGAPNTIAHRRTVLKVGFTGRTPDDDISVIHIEHDRILFGHEADARQQVVG